MASLLFVSGLGLAAACATSTPVRQTTGAGGAGGAGTSAGWLVGTTGSGTRSCGVNSSDMACTACINARCCDEGKACGEDPNCLSCVGKPESPALCENNTELSAFTICLQGACADSCLGGSSTSSSAGGGGATTASSSGGASSSSATTSTSASSTTSTSASSSSASSTSSSSSAASSSSGGGPLTCASVDGNAGCCDDSGVLHYCSDGSTVQDLPCGGGVCGWNPSQSYYDCVLPPGGADPSGTYPIACGN